MQLLSNNLAVPWNNKELPYDPAIPLLGIYLREMKTYVYIKPVYECSYQHYL